MKRYILVILFCLLAGCVVSDETIQWAQKVCANNGGLSFITNNRFVQCKNGAKFDKKTSTYKE